MIEELIETLQSDPWLSGAIPPDPNTGLPGIYSIWSPKVRKPYVTLTIDQDNLAGVSGTVASGNIEVNCWDSGSSIIRARAIANRIEDLLDFTDLETARGPVRMWVRSSSAIEESPEVVRWNVTVATRMLREAAIAARVDRSSPALVDINTATESQLSGIQGITQPVAQAIISYRQSSPFTDVRELLSVPGIGPKRYDSIKSFVTV